MPSGLADLLADLGSALQAAGRDWYLFGAQAAVLYGSARLTADVDATVDAPLEVVEALLVPLALWHFEARVENPTDFARTTRVLPLLHTPSGMPCDLVLGGPGLEELFLERAEIFDVEGVRVPVARADDIVVMKILAGRPKDLEDAAAILRAAPETLNLASAHSLLAELENALDRGDLLPVLEQLLSEIENPPARRKT
ncbi:MAG: hypothetical protein VCC00_04440 [Deltaproteobacteria bacterium]